MPRTQPPKGKIAPVADRVRGAITAVLTISCLTAAANVQDAQWAVSFGIAGIIYLITTAAIMFDSVETLDQ